MKTKTYETSFAPHATLIVVQVLFGTFPVIGKIVLGVIPAISLVGFRVGITAAILFAVQFYKQRIWLEQRSDYLRLAILSLFGVTFNQLLFVGGLSLTKASNASLLLVTIPIFTLAASTIAGTEKLRAVKALGIIIAAAGVIFLLDPRNASFSSQTTLGDIMIILNSLCFGIYVATSKSIVTRNGALRSMMWVFIFAGIICVPLGLNSLLTLDVAAVSPKIWLFVLYIGIFATTVPYFLNAWALSRVNPSVVTVYIYLQPIIGFILAVIFLNEMVDFKFIVAAILVFAGVFLTTRRAKTSPA